MKIMNKFIRSATLIMLFFSFPSCSQDDGSSNLVSIGVATTPIVLLTDRILTISNDIEITLTAPWSLIHFKSSNNATRIVTVLAGSYIVTDPLTGQRRVIALRSIDLDDISYQGVIFPSKDTNCDGLVDDAEATAGVELGKSCTQLLITDSLGVESRENVNILDTKQFYLTDMASAGGGSSGTDIEDSLVQLYKGLSFSVEARIEGWFGTPDKPESNFFQEFFFEATAN